MAIDRQMRNVEWNVANEKGGGVDDCTQASVAVLMDIRAELRTLNRLFHCTNFMEIPHVLKRIEKAIPRRKKSAKLRRVA